MANNNEGLIVGLSGSWFHVLRPGPPLNITEDRIEAGVTDARFYRYAGMPTIIYGPLGELAHGPNEYVNVDSLEKQANIYLGLINNYLNGQ